MIPIDLANLISASLPSNVNKNIVREGRKIKMLFNRGKKQVTLHIEFNNVTMKKNGKIITLPYDKDKILKAIKKEFNL